jgi:hypothetical protein
MLRVLKTAPIPAKDRIGAQKLFFRESIHKVNYIPERHLSVN